MDVGARRLAFGVEDGECAEQQHRQRREPEVGDDAAAQGASEALVEQPQQGDEQHRAQRLQRGRDEDEHVKPGVAQEAATVAGKVEAREVVTDEREVGDDVECMECQDDIGRQARPENGCGIRGDEDERQDAERDARRLLPFLPRAFTG